MKTTISERKTAVMNPYVIRIIRFIIAYKNKLKEDHVSAYSAMSSYFLLMSFVPFFMLILMMVKYLPISSEEVMGLISRYTQTAANPYIQEILDEIFLRSNGAIVGVTILTLLWAASKGMWAIIKGLHSVYDIEDTRNTILLRITSMFYTLALMLVILITLILLVFGTSIYHWAAARIPLLSSVAGFLMYFKGFFVLFVLTGFFLILYRVLPDHRTKLLNELPGALLSALGWTVFSFGFSIYVQYFSNYTTLYGSLGVILLFFLWLYLNMYLFFLGAEINYFLSADGKKRIRKGFS